MTKFTDYNGEEIFLSEDVWEKHIKVDHAEISLEIIKAVLLEPSVACLSQHDDKQTSILYHQGPWKNKRSKDRYYRVVVKSCEDGNWISTAHIRARISCGEIIFKEGNI